VRSSFQSVSGRAGAQLTIMESPRTVLATRAGGKILFGEFPFHEAAFIGGGGGARSIGFQSFEGDASLYGSAELRTRLTRFRFLLPLDAGVAALADASRVFADGDTFSRWNQAHGAGLWLGLRDSPTLITFTLINENGRSRFRMRSGLTF
jgi:hemolysin activation/secretion protein